MYMCIYQQSLRLLNSWVPAAASASPISWKAKRNETRRGKWTPGLDSWIGFLDWFPGLGSWIGFLDWIPGLDSGGLRISTRGLIAGPWGVLRKV